MTPQTLAERVSALEARFSNLERDQRDDRKDLKDATREIRDLAEELRAVSNELKGAISTAVGKATRPMDRLWWGWRVIVGVGSSLLAIVTFIGGILGITAYINHK